VWHNRLLQSGALAEAERHWLDTFAGGVTALELPTDYPRPPVQSFEGGGATTEAEPELSDALRRLGEESGATLYMVLLAVYSVLLSKYTGQDDLIVGTPAAGRSHPDTAPMIGMFVHTLPMRCKPSGSLTFRSFLEQIKATSLQAFEHQDYPLERVMERLAVKRAAGRNPLFDTVFSVQNQDMASPEWAGLSFLPYERESRTAQFDLALKAVEDGRCIVLHAEYAGKLFRRETAERMLRDYLDVARIAAEQPDARLEDIRLKTPDILDNVLSTEIEFTF
jgi:non-ribosomal peptide synthetase component F